MKEVYRLTGVCYGYGARPALKGISFSVGRGETVAVLGANGSGKSTLLKMLDALIFPASGKVTFFGDELAAGALRGDFLKCFRKRVGFLFAEPDVQLFSETVYDELIFGPLQLDLKPEEAEARVKDLLALLGMEALADRPPYTLSGGEKKKAAIGAVLSVDPDVLLLDEPTNGLDPRTQVWLFELLEGLKKLEKTLIISTHDLSLASDIADRVVVIDESHELAADGFAGEILKDKALLLRANIIHEHTHRHGGVTHTHSHGPYAAHDEHD